MPDEGNAFKTGGLNPVRLDLPADIYRSSYWAGLGFLFLVIAWPAPFMLANTAIWLGWGKGAAVVVAIAAFVAGIAAWLGWQFRLKPRLQAREKRVPVARITSEEFIQFGAPHLSVRWDDMIAIGPCTAGDGETAVYIAHIRTPRPRLHRGRLIRIGAFSNRRLRDDEIELPLQGFWFSEAQMRLIYETMVRRAGGRVELMYQ